MTESRMWQDRHGPPRGGRNDFGGEYLPASVGDAHCETLLMAGEGSKRGVTHKQGSSQRLKDLVSRITRAPKANIEPRRSTRISHRDEPDDEEDESLSESSFSESSDSSQSSDSSDSSDSNTLRKWTPLL